MSNYTNTVTHNDSSLGIFIGNKQVKDLYVGGGKVKSAYLGNKQLVILNSTNVTVSTSMGTEGNRVSDSTYVIYGASLDSTATATANYNGDTVIPKVSINGNVINQTAYNNQTGTKVEITKSNFQSATGTTFIGDFNPDGDNRPIQIVAEYGGCQSVTDFVVYRYSASADPVYNYVLGDSPFSFDLYHEGNASLIQGAKYYSNGKTGQWWNLTDTATVNISDFTKCPNGYGATCYKLKYLHINKTDMTINRVAIAGGNNRWPQYVVFSVRIKFSDTQLSGTQNFEHISDYYEVQNVPIPLGALPSDSTVTSTRISTNCVFELPYAIRVKKYFYMYITIRQSSD